ncbi:ATP-binding protein [uncultured Megasphaera sp.]|uniref:ATP-binding protein n=1 Tax=uncultured Megasphaera sp. TaxID=165188 RepID=UPI00265B1B4E|nr:ATP-binding protein [uncultured Megasphaera sp.]
MNFIDTLQSAELVLAAGEVPLLVGETGIGKTSLAREIARKNDWSLIGIDGNLLKEGEIGGLPTIETYERRDAAGQVKQEKTTIYAVHNKLRAIDAEIAKGRTVLLFIDEINRCEHAVQQELMNLILNREINGHVLSKDVRILAAMNPTSSYDYEAVDMDAAQKNRFVWLYMEPDYLQWLDWAEEAGIDPKVMEFISTFPEYLDRHNDDDINATPRSYERISALYKIYKEQKQAIPQSVFFNVIRGNVGKLIAEEFVHFVTTDAKPLISYDDVFAGTQLNPALSERVTAESHTRLYLAAKNLLKRLDSTIDADGNDAGAAITRLMGFISLYPVDLRIGIMKDIKAHFPRVYAHAIDSKVFVDAYFQAFRTV